MEKQIKMSLEMARELAKVCADNEGAPFGSLSKLLLENFTLEELRGKEGFSWEDSFAPGFIIKNTNSEAANSFCEPYIGKCWNPSSDNKHFKNQYKTEAQAKSALAFAQLSHIVDRYNQGKASGSAVYTISTALCQQTTNNPLYVRKVQYVSNVAHLLFFTEQDAETSLRVNKQLWIDYWMI